MNPLLVFAISLLLPVIPAPKEARMSDRPFDRLDFMTYPRLFAFAEAAWTERRDYPDFLGRLENVYEWMDGIGLYYYDIRNPEHHPEPSYP
ncbi:MAG: hypothetical protein IJL56_06465 [Bacteroidales bacterium]|nr:hypothetical protein [Bacteroidales bacterium]